MQSRGRAIRLLVHAGKITGLGTTFVGALAIGAFLHTGTPAFRRTASNIATQLLGDLFQGGKIVVQDVTSLKVGATGSVRISRVDVFDPDGAPVIVATGVSSSIDLRALLSSITSGRAPIVKLGATSIDNVELVLDVDRAGKPKIATTFAAKPKPARAPKPPKAPSQVDDPEVHLPRLLVHHAWVHGTIVPPVLDADADDLVASFDLEHKTASIGLARAKTTLRSPRAPHQKADLVGVANGAIAIAIEQTKLQGHASLADAHVGEVPVTASANIDGEAIDAKIQVARTSPEALATAFTDLPVTKPVELEATAHGTLPQIGIDVRARVGDSDVVAKAAIDTTEKHAFKLDVDASQIDVSAFGADVTSNLAGKLHAEGALGPDVPQGTFTLTTTPGTVSTERIPQTTIEGRFDAPRIVATVQAREPGVSVSGNVTFDVTSQMATFDLDARSSSLRSLSRAPNVIEGSASVRARGTANVARGTLEATAQATGDGIAVDAFSTNHIEATATVAGPLKAPIVNVGFAAVDMKLTANGKAPLVYPEATGRARVAIAPTPHIVDASVRVGATGDPKAIVATAREIRFGRGGASARGVEVKGLGNPLELDVELEREQWRVVAKSAGVDLHRVAAATGIKELGLLPEGTRAMLDVDVRHAPQGADGHLDVVLRSEKGAIGTGSLVVEAHATIDRGKLTGHGKVAAEGFGEVAITRADVDVPARLDGKSLARTTGVIELRGKVDLSQGAALFAGEHVERVAGIASFEALLERPNAAILPTVRGTVRTEGLEVAFAGDPSSETVVVSGVELLGNVAWNGHTDDAEVSLLSWDKHGLLGSAGVKAKVPLLAWATGAKKPNRRELGNLVVSAALDVPSRDVSELPAALKSLDLRGRVYGRVRVAGTLGEPQVILSARAEGIDENLGFEGPQSSARNREPSFQPLDGTLEANWVGSRAAITFALDERARPRRRRPREHQPPAGGVPPPQAQGRAVAKTPGKARGLIVITDIKTQDLLDGRPLPSLGWRASTEIEVENLALAALRLKNGLTGVLTGRGRIRDLNHDPSFEAKAHVDGFGSGGVTVSSVDVTVGGRDKSLFAHASLLDKSGNQNESKATVQLASQSLRVQGFDVTWDHAAPTRVDYAVQNGRLALLAPIVKASIPEIDGRVDGAGSIAIDESGQVFEGGLAVHEGRVYINTLGEEVTNLTAIARFDRSGAWKIENASGTIGAGEFRASASGKMKGLRLASAEATLVASKGGIPISSEGATFAEATGEVKLAATLDEAKNDLVLTVVIPRADVKLPDRTPQQLESLDPDPTIAVGVRKRNGELDRTAIRKSRGGAGNGGKKKDTEAMVTRMTVTLGNQVRLEGRDMEVALEGRTLVEINDELTVTGRIDLRGGHAIVHGRRFTIDRGTVNFPAGGDPSNPTLVAAAFWDAPDRTRIWVEIAGPVKTPKLELRSEPAYNKNQILSILLFGRSDPNVATPSGTTGTSDNAGGATAVGSGFVASDVNRLLSEIDENLDVETDPMSGNRTRTRIGRSFFDRRLKVQLAVAPGRPTPREPDTTFVFLNWQFMPKWSLQGTYGNKGTSILDVLFQHRY